MTERPGPRTETPVLVTGGAGNLGRRVVARLGAAGREVRVLSRQPHPDADGVSYLRGDLATGDGIAAAVAGVGTVVHCAGGPKGDEDMTRMLVRAAAAAGVTHLVFISVVGADRVPVRSRVDRAMVGYFESKLAAERVVADSGIPYTTLRATQFHDLVLSVAQGLAKLPVILVPAARCQPVDVDLVADRLTELSLGEPAGLVAEVGGPHVQWLPELIRDYLRATGHRRPVVGLPLAGSVGRAFRDGANLTEDRLGTGQTFKEFLTSRFPPRLPA